VTEPRTCEFGDVYVDFSRISVKRGGKAVDLEPKVFDVLRFLMAHRDRLVTKEELLENVWPGTFVAPNIHPDRRERRTLARGVAKRALIEARNNGLGVEELITMIREVAMNEGTGVESEEVQQ